MDNDNEAMKHCKCPPKCFCRYDENELQEIGYNKLIRRIPTIELLKEAKTDREKELISVVAMIDLDDVVAEIMIREKMSTEDCDVLGCRNNLKARLFKLLGIKNGRL